MRLRNISVLGVLVLLIVLMIPSIQPGSFGGKGGGRGRGRSGGGPNAITNLISTLRIVTTLCYIPGTNSPWVAKGFIGCYDGVKGKELYFKCMRRTNGYLLDTEEHIQESACNMPWKTPKYVMCLMQEFRKARIDLNAATARVNACQAKAVGVGRNNKG